MTTRSHIDGHEAASATAALTPAPVPAQTAPAAPTPHSRLQRWNAALPAPLSHHTLVFLLSGALARGTSATLTSPLDATKVRVQFSQRGAAAKVTPYASGLEAARDMWAKEGAAAFYRGLPARLVYIVPAAAVSFVFYEQFRALYHAGPEERQGRSSWVVGVPLLLGGLARVAGTAMRTPFDTIRQRMQIQGSLPSRQEQLARPVGERTHGVFANSAEALVRVTKVEGVRALWAGLGATILRDVPFAAVYFFAYESSKTLQSQWLGQQHDVRSPSADAVVASAPGLPLAPAASTGPVSKLEDVPLGESRAAGLSTPRYMLSGAFAAACAVFATQPADCVKTRLQTQGSLAPELRYKGVVDCARGIYREAGARGFMKGLVPRIMYLSPAAALTFSLYELYKSKLEVMLAPKE